jgi:hypothetical protein
MIYTHIPTYMAEIKKEATFTGNKHNYTLLRHDVVVYLIDRIPLTYKNSTFVLACHLNSYGYHTY